MHSIDLHSFHSVHSMNTHIFTLHMWLRAQRFYSAFLTNTPCGNLFEDLCHSTHSAYLVKAGSFIRHCQQMPMVPFRVLCAGENSLILCIWGRQPNKSYTFFSNSFLHLFKGQYFKKPSMSKQMHPKQTKNKLLYCSGFKKNVVSAYLPRLRE